MQVIAVVLTCNICDVVVVLPVVKVMNINQVGLLGHRWLNMLYLHNNSRLGEAYRNSLFYEQKLSNCDS